jgi:tetratricopeptide (TPR) repeat protein
MSSLHQRAKDVFLEALDRPEAERVAWLAEACANDAALRQEVESLLTFHDDAATDEVPAAPEEPMFAPGQVFAGRYQMITLIGRGGMGQVWQAEDLVLKTTVALKLIDSASPQARERILNEVRLARQVTHPAVCRVFDVGEADGGIFYSMELVRGEDLASLLRRVGRLPSEKVIDIAHQLCAGLAAAHAQHVLHRDLKPANVLIDDDGFVRITDFGIAIPRTDAGQHLRTGTPRYMAPEQRAHGAALSERTDVFALGLVLYELLVGSEAFNRPTATTILPKPSTLAPNVDPQLERVIMHAVSPDPKDRPASAFEMAVNLPEIGTTRLAVFGVTPVPRQRRAASWWLAGAALALLIGGLAVGSSYLVRPQATLTEQDTIVLADFDNTTGEPVFDGALKVALAVALEQSPFIKVFPDDRARDTLRLMRRSPDERINRTLAREIARRERLKALLAGSIVSLGRNYVVTLEAINAETGDVMAREQVEAAGKELVLTSLGTVTSRMREKLGESLASVKRFDVALPRATTESLDALHAYSLALSEGVEVPRLEAIPQLQRAIELDPNFAMAHAFLSGVYANTGQSSLAPAYSRRAFELRDRVSERERFFIAWRYYRDAVLDWEKALELAESWTATYPREAFAFNSLGSAYLRLGQFDKAVAPFRQAIRLDPKFVPSYSNLAASFLALNQYDDARAILKQAAERQLDFNGARRLSYLLAFVQGDPETMDRELAGSIGLGETNAAFGWQAHTSAFAGHMATAHEQFRRGIQMALQNNFTEVAAQLTTEDGENHAIIGECAEARRDAAAGMALSRDNATLERASRTLALCGAGGEASSLSAELAKRFPSATFTNRVSLPVTAAAAAMSMRDPRRAIALLDPVRPFDHAPSAEFWPAYLRGQALLEVKDGGSAAAEFEKIVGHRGEVPTSVLFPLAQLGLARAQALMNDTSQALRSYEAFLAMWKDADPGLTPLKEARAEYARILPVWPD